MNREALEIRFIVDITEIPEFEFFNNLLDKLNKKLYKNKGKDSINLILRRM